ncbi:hypothetical protein HY745_10410 [Candidatus Desantisbacteria bacterium]|nr:hypothetical protein [Candidatus Desantisbacteria bacterium]
MQKVKIKDICNVVCFNKEVVSKLNKMMPSNPGIEEIADTFSILGDKTRVKIVFALSIVRFRNDGNMVYYSLVNRYIENLLTDAFKHLRKLENRK